MEMENPENSFFEPQLTPESVKKGQRLTIAQTFMLMSVIVVIEWADLPGLAESVAYGMAVLFVFIFLVMNVKFFYIERKKRD